MTSQFFCPQFHTVFNRDTEEYMLNKLLKTVIPKALLDFQNYVQEHC